MSVLSIALSKGRILAETLPLLERLGLPPREDPEHSRKLVIPTRSRGVRLVVVRASDVPTYVEYGAADCGVAGRDVLLESGSDVYEPLDLAFGRCRLVVAAPRGFEGAAASTVRVATKYPKVAAAHFQGKGVSVEVVRLAGSVELAPGLGLADCIVDVVETGRTLAENGLAPVEEIAASSARLIVNRASFHARRREVASFLRSLGEAVA